MGSVGLLASFSMKGLFWYKFATIQVFQLFKACFSTVELQNIVDIHRINFLWIQMYKKGVQKLQKCQFFSENEFDKNTCKIQTYGPRDRELVLKIVKRLPDAKRWGQLQQTTLKTLILTYCLNVSLMVHETDLFWSQAILHIKFSNELSKWLTWVKNEPVRFFSASEPILLILHENDLFWYVTANI